MYRDSFLETHIKILVDFTCLNSNQVRRTTVFALNALIFPKVKKHFKDFFREVQGVKNRMNSAGNYYSSLSEGRWITFLSSLQVTIHAWTDSSYNFFTIFTIFTPINRNPIRTSLSVNRKNLYTVIQVDRSIHVYFFIQVYLQSYTQVP